MIFMFFGFSQEEADEAMVTVAGILKLGHPKHSHVAMPAVAVTDYDGHRIGSARAIGVPGFDKVRQQPGLRNQISKAFGDISVFMIEAPVLNAVGDERY